MRGKEEPGRRGDREEDGRSAKKSRGQGLDQKRTAMKKKKGLTRARRRTEGMRQEKRAEKGGLQKTSKKKTRQSRLVQTKNDTNITRNGGKTRRTSLEGRAGTKKHEPSSSLDLEGGRSREYQRPTYASEKKVVFSGPD